MKTNITLLLAGAVALGFTLTTAKADEPFLSPKGKANQISRVSGVDTSPNLVTHDYPGVAAKNSYYRPAPVEIAPLKEKSK